MRQHVIRARDLEEGDYIILSERCRAMVVAIEHCPKGREIITHELVKAIAYQRFMTAWLRRFCWFTGRDLRDLTPAGR